MAEDHGAPEPDNSPGPGPKIAEKQRVAKEQRIRSRTVQNEMRDVLRQVTAGAA